MTISPIFIDYVPRTTSLNGPNDVAYWVIKKKLDELGITTTGNLQTDKLLLEQALSNKKTQSNVETQTQYTPWNDILAKLGLSSTNNRTEDYNLIIKTLDNLISTTNDQSRIAYYESLLQDTENAFNIPEQKSAITRIGANYISELNRLMLVNMRN